MSEETRESFFDELARGFASGSVSRRKALRLMGAALFGGLLAGIPGVAGADPGACPDSRRKCGKAGCCPEGEVCLTGGRIRPPRCGTDCPGGECPPGQYCCAGVIGFPRVCCPNSMCCLPSPSNNPDSLVCVPCPD